MSAHRTPGTRRRDPADFIDTDPLFVHSTQPAALGPDLARPQRGLDVDALASSGAIGVAGGPARRVARVSPRRIAAAVVVACLSGVAAYALIASDACVRAVRPALDCRR